MRSDAEKHSLVAFFLEEQDKDFKPFSIKSAKQTNPNPTTLTLALMLKLLLHRRVSVLAYTMGFGHLTLGPILPMEVVCQGKNGEGEDLQICATGHSANPGSCTIVGLDIKGSHRLSSLSLRFLYSRASQCQPNLHLYPTLGCAHPKQASNTTPITEDDKARARAVWR